MPFYFRAMFHLFPVCCHNLGWISIIFITMPPPSPPQSSTTTYQSWPVSSITMTLTLIRSSRKSCRRNYFKDKFDWSVSYSSEGKLKFLDIFVVSKFHFIGPWAGWYKKWVPESLMFDNCSYRKILWQLWSKDGLTSLHVACRDSNIPAIEALCLHPLVNVNERSDSGDTPLMLAIIGGHVEAVRKLVSNDLVNLEDLDYRERINFDNGHIVHSFLTILGNCDQVVSD